MTKTLDIPQDEIECARQLTRAETDEDAIRLAVKAFNLRGEPYDDEPIEVRPTSPEQVARIRELLIRGREEAKLFLKKELARVEASDPKRALAILGTLKSLASDEEFEQMRRDR